MLICLQGKNEYLIEKAITSYKTRAGDFDWVELHNPTPKELAPETFVNPLMANFRCVIVRGIKNLTDSATTAAVFENKESMCQIVLVTESFQGNKRLNDLFKTQGKIEKFRALHDKTAKEYLVDQLKSYDLKMSDEVMGYFLFLVGNDAAAIDTNLELFANSAGAVTMQKVRATVYRRTDINIFKLLDTIYDPKKIPYDLMTAFPDKMQLLNMLLYKTRQAIIVKSSKSGIVGGNINAYAAKILRKQVRPIELETLAEFYARLHQIFYIVIRSNQNNLDTLLTEAVVTFRGGIQ